MGFISVFCENLGYFELKLAQMIKVCIIILVRSSNKLWSSNRGFCYAVPDNPRPTLPDFRAQ